MRVETRIESREDEFSVKLTVVFPKRRTTVVVYQHGYCGEGGGRDETVFGALVDYRHFLYLVSHSAVRSDEIHVICYMSRDMVRGSGMCARAE